MSGWPQTSYSWNWLQIPYSPASACHVLQFQAYDKLGCTYPLNKNENTQADHKNTHQLACLVSDSALNILQIQVWWHMPES